DLAVVAALLGAGAIALWSDLTRSPYNTAKSLAVLAPLVVLAIAPALAEAWRRGAGRGAPALRALGVVLAVGSAATSVVALRDAPRSPPARGRRHGRRAAAPGRRVAQRVERPAVHRRDVGRPDAAGARRPLGRLAAVREHDPAGDPRPRPLDPRARQPRAAVE